jgi:hypothetical protein
VSIDILDASGSDTSKRSKRRAASWEVQSAACRVQCFAKRLTHRKNRNADTSPQTEIYITRDATRFFPDNYITIPARLPDDVIYCIQLCLEYRESLPAIYKATQVLLSTIYHMQLNLDLFGQPYTPSTIMLGQPKALLPAQELVISNIL